MIINIDFKKSAISMDEKTMQLTSEYEKRKEEIMREYTRVKAKISKYFIHKSINYAELLAFLFYQNDHYFTRAPGMVTIINYIEILDKIKENEKLNLEIDDLYYEAFKKCAKLVSTKKRFKIYIKKERYTKRRLDPIYNNPVCVRNLLKARIFTRFLIGSVRKTLKKDDNQKVDVLILSNIRFEGKTPADNTFFGEVVKELDERKIKNKMLKYEELIQLNTLKNFIKKFTLRKQSYIGDYYSLKHFKECKKDFNSLKQKWDIAKNDPNFKEIFTYKGYNYYDIIEPKLKLTFEALSYMACDNINITKKIIETEKYNVIVLDHEENFYGKGFMLNTRLEKNRKTLALSHEIIWPGCLHTCMKDKRIQNRESLLWRPLPDIKCVWSKYSSDVLLNNCNYPKDIIRITGNPKFDFLIKTQYNNKETIEKYNLSKTKKRMLCTLWPVTNISDTGYLDEINDISKTIDDVEFIIKPHPMDINIERIREKIKENKNPSIKYIDNKENIYPIIEVCDYILTDGSTVGFEALFKDKIVFGWVNKDFYIPPFLKGVVQIRELSTLKKELKKIKKKENLNNLIKKTKILKHTFHYKEDGKSSERVASIISNLLNRKEKLQK